MDQLPSYLSHDATIIPLHRSLSSHATTAEVPPFSLPADHPMHQVVRDLSKICETWSQTPLSSLQGEEFLPHESVGPRPSQWLRASVAAGLAVQLWAEHSRVSITRSDVWNVHRRLTGLWDQIIGAVPAWNDGDFDDLCQSVLYALHVGGEHQSSVWWAIQAVAGVAKRPDAVQGERTRLLLSRVVERCPPVESHELQHLLRLWDAAGDDSVLLRPSEPWTSRAIEELGAMWPEERAGWARLIRWCASVEGAMPTRRQEEELRQLLSDIGTAKAHARILPWVAMFDQAIAIEDHRRELLKADWTQEIQSSISQAWAACTQIHRWQALHQRVAKGLAWALRSMPIEESGPVLERTAITCFSRGFLPGTCSALVGSACVAGLAGQAQPRAVAHLMRVRERSRTKPGRAAAERGLTVIAKELGVTRDDVEEIAVPTFGLGPDGRRVSPCGEGTLELRLSEHGSVSVVFRDAAGRERRSIPASASKASPEVVTQAKADAKVLRGVLASAHRRLERGLRQHRVWNADVWRTRILAHPVLRVAANGLIWGIGDAATGSSTRCMLLVPGGAVGPAGQPTALPGPGERVWLWHPTDSDAAEIETWKRCIEDSVTQPFRQAHREVYRPDRTDGKDPARSRRFADIVVRQRTLAGLCKSREWVMSLYIQDSGSPPEWRGSGDLPSARIEVRPIESAIDENGGQSHLMAGDVLFFERVGHTERLVNLDCVSPRYFSEIMRDVDLLVSVAGITRDSALLGAASVGDPIEWRQFASHAPSAVVRQRADTVRRLVDRGVLGPHVGIQDDRMIVQGGLATYEVRLSDNSVMIRENGLTFEVVESGIADEFVSPRLPYVDDDRLVRIVRTALMLTHDVRLQNEQWIRRIHWRPGMEP